jgi:hypothetical protein
MKLTISHWLLFGLLLFVAGFVHAEGVCPPGMFPTNPPGAQGPVGCAPIPGYNSNQQKNQQRPPQIWEPRWGAIATDGPGGSFGASINMPNQLLAKDAALADCRSKKGSTACSVDLSYGNQCGAMVVGDSGHNSNPGLTAHLAIQAAMEVCNKTDKHCFIYYTACSMPVRVQ